MTLETKLGYKIDFKTDRNIAIFDNHELVYKKQVSIILEYRNRILQTNPRDREEEPQNIYSNKTYVRQ